MLKYLKRFGIVFTTLAVAVVAVIASDSYFGKLFAADQSYIKWEDQLINDYWDKFEENQEIDNKNSESNKNPTDGKNNDSNENKGEGKDEEVPVFTNGYDAFAYAENLMKKGGLKITTTGRTDTSAGISTTFKNRKMRSNEGYLYFSAANYSSVVKVGVEAYYNIRQFKFRKTDLVSSGLEPNYNNVLWSNSTTTQFKKDLGSMPDELNYIVNKETAQCTDFDDSNNDVYTFTMKLDAAKATERYKHQVKYMAGAESFPTFKHVTLKITMYKNGKFKQIEISESYNITVTQVGVSITTTCSINAVDVFEVVNGKVEIPLPSGL